MTGPEILGDAGSSGEANGVSVPQSPARKEAASPARLKTRAQFVNVAKGARFNTRLFSLQAAPQTVAVKQAPRIGFTVTRKTGGAVERNRMRRRLKEAIRVAPDLCAAPGYDYVLVIRRETLSAPFMELVADLTRAFRAMASREQRLAETETEPQRGERARKARQRTP